MSFFGQMKKMPLVAMSQNLSLTKPKLRKVTGIWFCLSKSASGSGETPKLAFDRWSQALARELAYVWN